MARDRLLMSRRSFPERLQSRALDWRRVFLTADRAGMWGYGSAVIPQPSFGSRSRLSRSA